MFRNVVRARAGALRLALLLALGLIASSCVTLTAESEINEDLSGTHTLTVTMDRSVLESLGEEFNPDDVQDQMTPDSVPEGYEVEVIDTEDEVGSTITTTVEDSGPLGDVLNDLFNAGETEGEPVNPFSGTLDKDGNTYRLNVTVDGDVLAQSGQDDVGGGEDLGIDMSDILDMTYAINLPGEIEETNGTELEDGSVQWTLPTSGTLDMRAVSETEGDSNLLLWLLVLGIGALLLVGLAVVVALVVLMARRKREPAVAPAAPIVPPVTPPTRQSNPYADTPPTPQLWIPPSAGASDEELPPPQRPAGSPPIS